MYLKTTIAVVAIMLVSTAHAIGNDAASHSLPRYPVAEYVSNPGESQPDFLARTGLEMRKWSDATAFESCGVLAMSDDGRFGIRVSTSKAHVGCLSDPKDIPVGMTPMDATLHTHGARRAFMLNNVDVVMFGGNRGLPGTRYANPDKFSADDFANGPGYLAGTKGIWYQHGEGTAAIVATYP